MAETHETAERVRTPAQQNKAWKILLAEKGMSAYALAKRIDAPYTTVVHALERDITVMSLGTAMAIARELGYTVEELVRRIRYR